MPPTATVVASREAALNVADVMITDVKISHARTTVGEVRTLFANEHVHAAVIVEDGVLLAVVDRLDLAGRSNDARAAPFGSLGSRVVTPDTDLDEARQALLASGRRRLAVIDEHDRLLGLLCLKRTRRGFCSDRDVHARR